MADLVQSLAPGAENVVVGQQVARFRYATRVIHWGVALTFLLCLGTGLPIWTPLFGWMATLVGGLAVCRWLHPWSGVAFAAMALVQFFHWVGEMRMSATDRDFMAPSNFAKYLRWELHDENVGKYNGGQKAQFWTSSLAALGLLVSGVVLWWPEFFPTVVRQWSWVLHDVTFILFVLMILGHVYLTIAEPGTLRAMLRGTVTRQWAKLHHPKWYRDVTGGDGR
jgi:formate dehydrogenase subunit gamma